MKSFFTLSLSGILLFTGVSKAQQVGLSTDVVVGIGLKSMGKTVPVHGGVTMGFLYSPKSSPVSFGYRYVLNSYSNFMQKELPFYREDYIHDVANITNSHSILQNLLFARIELNKNGGVSPFIEGGAGYAQYKSKWTASDPYETDNNNCEGYMDHATYLKSGTFIANASTGVNIKFNKLKGRDNCSGVWLTLAVDYSIGGKVNYLNSKINSEQFFYDEGAPVLTGKPRSMPATTSNDHRNSSIMPGGCYKDYNNQSSFTEKHELLQFRVGVTFVFGKCK